MKRKTIILAGSGHAHLEVLKLFSKNEFATHRFMMISPHRQSYYSGLIPRLISGEVEPSQLTIHSADYAEKKGVEFIQDSIQAFNPQESTVTLAGGATEHFDILSLNVGGDTLKIPSQSPFNTIYLKPFDEFIQNWRDVQRICSACMNPRFVVIGGGAAAVEVATALRIRLNRNQAQKSEVHLVTQGNRLCESYSKKISAAIHASAIAFGIQVHLQEPLTQILEKHILLQNGKKLKFDSIFVATATKKPDLIPGPVDATLRLTPNIFAVGDCTSIKNQPTLPRSGVTAVHQGRHLANCLRSVLNGASPVDFKIRKHSLNILITSDQTARLVWGQQSFEGALALKIKNWIDQRYLSSFQD
ncbi:MAG: hypothetical protein A2622_09475 [Bdellovibrionales bacterium RIFCSPHIGHO2_01_FULL_40_29]|nr:MAG: hypothetical protein A2622_09475 [Bdellovibrionales bacterium RIFCSPHIGHO2_01_FULL_40_29]OFZ33547.1 MAG: hypothetical protein A3D17_00145 [Bdellovibrionales bacterium RIFCSPHIGHO2_02_FULL_40_15]